MDDLNQVTKQLSAAHIVDNIQQSTQNQVISISEQQPQNSFIFSGPHQAIAIQAPLAQRPNFIQHHHQQHESNQENNHENINHQQQNGLNHNYNHLNNDHQNINGMSPPTIINHHQHDGSDNDSSMT